MRCQQRDAPVLPAEEHSFCFSRDYIPRFSGTYVSWISLSDAKYMRIYKQYYSILRVDVN